MSFPGSSMPAFFALPGDAPMGRAADAVSATISQDRTAGATAAEESSFGMLAGHNTAGAGNGSTINPALLAERMMRPGVRPPPNFGAPPPHGHTPGLQPPAPYPLTPWGPENQQGLSSPTLDGGPGNIALQDYQLQLMLLEQQNKKRLMMARQEQDAIRPADADMHADQSAPAQLQDHQKQMMLMERQNMERLRTARQEHDAINAANGNIDTEPLDPRTRRQMALSMIEQRNKIMEYLKENRIPADAIIDAGPSAPPGNAVTQVNLHGKATEEEIPPRPAAITSEASTTRTVQQAADELSTFAEMSSGTVVQPPTAVTQCFQAPPPPPAPPASAATDMRQPMPKTTRKQIFQATILRAAQAKLRERQGNPPPGAVYRPTAQQLAAQRDAIRCGEMMASNMAGERERWLVESNNRLKAQMAQLWQQNRKLMATGPGQPFHGPPAILMAQNESSLFSDGPSEPMVQPAEDTCLNASGTDKGKSRDETRVPEVLLPGPGLPFQSEQQAQATLQPQPGSPGAGRKRSRDESAGQSSSIEPASNTIDLTGDDLGWVSPLREKRSRVVPVNSVAAEGLPSIVEDNDWECVAVSPPSADEVNLFEGPVLDFSKTLESGNAVVENLLEPRSPSSPCTLPELDDALMADVDADPSRQTNPAEANINKEAALSVLSAGNDQDAHQYFRTLHRVHCSKAICRGKTYADVPYATDHHAAGPGHIAGGTLISDLKAYVAQHRSVAWIVFRDYECPQQTSRNWTKPNESTSNEIHVVSEELKQTLTSISRCVPDGEEQTRGNANAFNRPPPPEGVYRPRFLYHHRTILQAIRANEPSRMDIQALLWFIEVESPDFGRLMTCDSMFSQGKVCFSSLPWLFCPNTVVVSHKQGPDSNIPAAYVVEDWPFEVDGGLQLNCWSWGYDGQRLHRRQTSLTVKVARDAIVDISSLSVYPATHMPDEIRQRLVNRGKQFWGYRNQHHVSYHGWDYQKERKYENGSRCMIDYQTYKKFHAAAAAFSFSRAAKSLYDRWPDSISNTANLSEDNLMLLPPEIHGFFLKDKRWDQITPVSWNKLAFERLVLPQKTKTLVQAMVLPRANKDAEAEPEVRGDLIAGKGNGLIMLLHGPPGTGKTLTAESVAELAEMPLYSVTCGDIGTSPEAVERYLSTVLHLGKTWNCDEADVFLEQRSMADLDRNSLVSVFLRTLEYYSGILILTSNRVSIFDEAFKSRIQVALSYPRLDKASRKRVWTNFINMIHEDGGRGPADAAAAKFRVDYEDIVSHMDDLADRELNGRQIRNAMATARQLAGYLGETLNWDHLDTAITTASDFTISQSADGA